LNALSQIHTAIEPQVASSLVGLQSEPVRVEKILVDGQEVNEVKPGSTCVLELSGKRK